MKRHHKMPFGAELQQGGEVRFRLWAPGVERADLCLETDGQPTTLCMNAAAHGWFDLSTEKAGVGSRYWYRLDGGLCVPDPASRYQPNDASGCSQVIDPEAWQWRDSDWRGRPWTQAVIYELHVGAFTAEGSYSAIERRLDHLVELGVTAIELMPLADFSGCRNWGYDGVLLFAPDSAYGEPDALKHLVQTAHQKGLMVLLDVVYNHFGPKGNYLPTYAPAFFTDARHTPWGTSINFDGVGSETVRQFFIHNALYWLEEYHLDGLRLDSAHAMYDNGSPHILEALAVAVHQGPGSQRPVHLVLENDQNAAHFLACRPNAEPNRYVAQWNDDLHHAMHLLLTGEADGYYADYAERPVWYLGRCLAQGFGYQGEVSGYRRGRKRGEPSAGLPPTAFVSFLQNHDQVGNRAYGERIHKLADEKAVRAALAVILLAPAPPLMFMGEEFAASSPFFFFCDFDAELGEAVAQGRLQEFSRFTRFSAAEGHNTIPDPNAPDTFQRSKLDWNDLTQARHRDWLNYYRRLLALRQERIVPLLDAAPGANGEFRQIGERALSVAWDFGGHARLRLFVNLGETLETQLGRDLPRGDPLFHYPPDLDLDTEHCRLPPWSVAWFVEPGH